MKKTVLLVVFVGMIGWTLYESIDWGGSTEPLVDRDVEVGMAENDGDEFGLKQGNIAPDFALQSLDGEVVRLSDFRGEKVLVNFWATWCPPCRAEMPDMQEVFEETDIQILAVNLTETEADGIEQVARFRDEFALSFPIVLDEEVEVATAYDIQPVPTSYFIDTEGRVQGIALGALNKDMIVQRFETIP